MGFDVLFFCVALFWAILHASGYVLKYCCRLESRQILPVFSRVTRKSPVYFAPRVVLHHVYLRIETSALNSWHDRLSSYFVYRSHVRAKRGLTLLYDAGSITGVLGMLLAMVILLLTSIRGLSSVVNSQLSGLQNDPVYGDRNNIHKRDFEPFTNKLDTVREPDPPVNLLIPGVTVPLSHLPILLLALFVGQLVHEAGHGISAAIDSVPLLSVGASLAVLIPSAFVSLSSAAVQNLPPGARLRIISAGAFHNLLFWVLLVVLSGSNVAKAIWGCAGYQYIGGYGRSVVDVSPDSPLRGSLPLGSVIMSIDDRTLMSNDLSNDLWISYLTHPHSSSDGDYLGWCIERDWFLAQTGACCVSFQPGSNQSCFVTENTGSPSDTSYRCAPTLPVIRPDSVLVKRCADSTVCGYHQQCAKLQDSQELVRLALWIPSSVTGQSQLEDQTDEHLDVVVWSGPRDEILDSVTVSTYLPRFNFLPLWPPLVFEIFFQYLATLTLSLYFFNLLPLPFLDGDQLLDAFLDFIKPMAMSEADSQQNILVQDMETGIYASVVSSRARIWPRHTKKGIQLTLGISIAISLISGLLHTG